MARSRCAWKANDLVLSYSALLTVENISSIAERFGFADKASVEKFIMDFEVHSHIAQQADCITRGGLCMPFHLPTTEAGRLSIDIDLLMPGWWVKQDASWAA